MARGRNTPRVILVDMLRPGLLYTGPRLGGRTHGVTGGHVWLGGWDSWGDWRNDLVEGWLSRYSRLYINLMNQVAILDPSGPLLTPWRTWVSVPSYEALVNMDPGVMALLQKSVSAKLWYGRPAWTLWWTIPSKARRPQPWLLVKERWLLLLLRQTMMM